MLSGDRRHQRCLYHSGSPESLILLFALAAQQPNQLMVPRKGLDTGRRISPYINVLAEPRKAFV
jgi:hypothetical protein